jgi:hypothetical protein
MRGSWWRTAAVALAGLAVLLAVGTRLLAGPRGATINVRWQATIDESTRRVAEARLRLLDGRPIDAGTWRYDLIDPSGDNVRALVQDPAVADTHELNRQDFSVSETAVRTGRRLRFAAGDTIVASADRTAIVLTAVAALLAMFGIAGLAATPRSLGATITRPVGDVVAVLTRTAAPLFRWLQRGIPEIDAQTAGLFRIVFGLALLAFCIAKRVDASWLSATFDLEVEGEFHAGVLHWLRQHPAVVDLLTPWLLVTCAAFTAGLFTRTSYALFVAGMLVWSFVAISLDSTHPLGTFMLALVALLPSRWGDGLSFDAWRKTRVPEPGKHHGYSVWIPGLAFGVGMAAAAWAKILRGPEWVLNGTIKYFFVTDSVIAPFDWGLQLAAHPWLAILVSAGAVAIEGLAISAAFVRSDLYRLAIGIGAFGLLAGFWVFMGHFWPGWWILLLGFLPWARVGRLVGRLPSVLRGPGKPAPTYVDRKPATAAQLALVVFVLGQQVVISTIKVERAPMFSHYPMYSGTYDSPEEYNARRPPRYHMLATTDKGVVTLPCSPHEEFVRNFESALKGSPEARLSVWDALRSCTGDVPVRDVRLEGAVEAFDWERLEFRSIPVPPLGPLTP